MVGEAGSVKRRAQMRWCGEFMGSRREPRPETEPECLELSLRGFGLFHTFLVGWEERLKRSHHLGRSRVVCLGSGHQGCSHSVLSIYPREWGTEKQQLGSLLEKEVLGKVCSHTARKPTRMVEMG